MFTKIAMALTIVLGTMTGALAATKKQSTKPTPNGFVGSQQFNYSGDAEYWRRFRDMGDYN